MIEPMWNLISRNRNGKAITNKRFLLHKYDKNLVIQNQEILIHQGKKLRTLRLRR
jgi:hypothetical protein